MENQLEEKPNWQQWIPIYGICKAIKDRVEGKASIMDSNYLTRYFGSMIYHAICSSMVIVGSIKGLEALLK
jgi:hypothetical protein